MTETLSLSVLVGSFLPLVITLVKRAGWSGARKKWFALACSAAAAVITVAASEGLELGTWLGWQGLLGSFGAVYTLGQTTYLGFWEDTKVEAVLESI
jgi:hypothetical protein